MKLKSKTLNIAGAILLAASLTGILSGCDSVIYDDSDCVESYNTVRFEYTYNMKNADAFAQEVKSVTLFFFNSATGKLVRRVDAPREKLKDGNKLDVAVEPGRSARHLGGRGFSLPYEPPRIERGSYIRRLSRGAVSWHGPCVAAICFAVGAA